MIPRPTNVEGKKYDGGKSRVDLIPPEPLLDIGYVLGHGAEKYGENNWQLVAGGENRYYAALLRHLFAWRQGEMIDPESGLSHLSHVATNTLFLMYLSKNSGGVNV
jgi:hypothetical protein